MNVDFIDSNVFVYLYDESDEGKRFASEKLIKNAINKNQGCISFQVVQETLHVITQKAANPASTEDAKRILHQMLAPLWRVMPSDSLYHKCLEIKDRYRYGFYDSLIIAAALEAGCKRIYSEDLQHGQKIERLTIINPFLTS